MKKIIFFVACVSAMSNSLFSEETLQEQACSLKIKLETLDTRLKKTSNDVMPFLTGWTSKLGEITELNKKINEYILLEKAFKDHLDELSKKITGYNDQLTVLDKAVAKAKEEKE
jgi:uncharacterized coiled-coil DUF342 family protein